MVEAYNLCCGQKPRNFLPVFHLNFELASTVRSWQSTSQLQNTRPLLTESLATIWHKIKTEKMLQTFRQQHEASFAVSIIGRDTLSWTLFWSSSTSGQTLKRLFDEPPQASNFTKVGHFYRLCTWLMLYCSSTSPHKSYTCFDMKTIIGWHLFFGTDKAFSSVISKMTKFCQFANARNG